MSDLECFFEKIEEEKVYKNRDNITFFIKGDRFCGYDMKTLASKIKYIIFHHISANIKIQVKTREIQDLATIIVFEYLIYYLLKYTNNKTTISFNLNPTSYSNNYLYGSLISCFINSNKNFSVKRKQYIEMFESNKVRIDSHRFRKLIKNSSNNSNSLNIVSTEISTFLKTKILDDDYREDCVEAIIEVCSNALEHTSSDCIVNLECSVGLDQNNNRKNILSVAISNVSNNLFHENLKNMHLNNQRKFDILDIAKETHQNFFTDKLGKYNEDFFYIISAFQYGISTRNNQQGTGGTGLMALICNILGKTVDNYCYILSGKDILFLKEDFIQPVGNKFIGFNREHDFLYHIPDKESLDYTPMYFNGTIFLLSLITDQEVRYEN